MHQDQIALVPQERKRRALSTRFTLHLGQRLSRFLRDLGSLGRRKLLPCGPTNAQHLMQHARAFERERYGR